MLRFKDGKVGGVLAHVGEVWITLHMAEIAETKVDRFQERLPGGVAAIQKRVRARPVVEHVGAVGPLSEVVVDFGKRLLVPARTKGAHDPVLKLLGLPRLGEERCCGKKRKKNHQQSGDPRHVTLIVAAGYSAARVIRPEAIPATTSGIATHS